MKNMEPHLIVDESDSKKKLLDLDSKSIEFAEKIFPDFEFIRGYFLDDLEDDRIFNNCINASSFSTNSKLERYVTMRKHAKKYINISLIFRLNGTAIIDKDTSYFYYLDTGERIHQVIHNILKFLNFISINLEIYFEKSFQTTKEKSNQYDL